jgi:hypothetical protein
VFFHGHDHFFAKQDKECMIYQETPQPSHANFSGTGTAAKYGYLEGLILPNSGHLRVNVTPESFKVEYVRAYNPKNETAARKNGDISATYVINKKNCYDSTSTSVPVLWNSAYLDEHVFPNPSRDQASIQLHLSTDDVINIMLYNEQGQEVRRILSDTPVNAGSYTIIWDGVLSGGIDAPSGSYTYRIFGRSHAPSSGTIVRVR